MKLTRRLAVLLGVLAALVALSAVLVAVDLLPELNRMRQKKKELERIEAEIKRSLLEVRLRSGQARETAPEDIPELPEIAAFISSVKRAEEGSGVRGLSFDTAQTERQQVMVPAAEGQEEPRQYLLSRLTLTFSSSLEQALAFLGEIQSGHPEESFDYLKVTSRSPGEDRVEVSLAVRLCGVPR